MGTPSEMFSPDKPLSDPKLDRFNYAPVAERLAISIQKMSPPEGLVIGIYGEWGLGKSTFIEFVIHYLEQLPKGEQPIIMRFNPWWFSGSENLVKRFFEQLQIILGNRFHRGVKGIVTAVKNFSDVIAEVPLPGAGVGKAVADIIPDINQKDVISLKDDIASKLEKAGKRILVVIDDIDRLEAEEIKQLFTVVKAIADFPNMIYLVGFDKNVVAEALGKRGKEFLEKIVQVPFELPLPSTSQMRQLLLENIEKTIGSVPQELYSEFFAPFALYGYMTQLQQIVNTPRNIKRLINSLTVTYSAVVGEVNPADFIVIETLRLFYPDLYDVIRRRKDIFTGVNFNTSDQHFYTNLRSQIQYPEYVDILLKELFPKLKFNNFGFETEWRLGRKICSPDVFDSYFRLTLADEDVSNAEMQIILSYANSSDELSKQITSFVEHNPNRVASFLQYLTDYSYRNISLENIPHVVMALMKTGQLFISDEVTTSSNIHSNYMYILRRILRNLLKRVPVDQQLVLLSDAMNNSDADLLAIEIIVDVEHSHKRMGETGFVPEEEILLREEDLPSLEKIALQKIHSILQMDGNIEYRDIFTVLHIWIDLEPAESKEWIREKLRSPKNLINFIDRFLSSRPFDPRFNDPRYTLDESILAFVDLGGIIERVNQELKEDNLEPKEKERLNDFISLAGKLERKG